MAKKKITSPSYLQSTPHGYYFRIKLPHDVRHIIGRTELKCSLRTGKLSEAKERSRILASLTQLAISNIRSGGRMAEISDTEIQNILRRYFQGSLQGDEDWRTNRKPLDDEELDEQALLWDEFETDFREDLAKSNYHNVSKYVTALVEDLNLNVKEDSETYQKLCRGMLKVQIDLLGIYQRRQFGDYEYEKRFIQAPTATLSDAPQSDSISK